MEQAVFQFLLQGKPVSCEKYGMGHINRTFLVVTDTGRRYILQCLNRQAFHNIPKLMENVQAVTEFLRKQSEVSLFLSGISLQNRRLFSDQQFPDR